MFNVGDEVEVVRDAPYSITTVGSQGTVIKVYNDSLDVQFHLLTSGWYGERELQDVYEIRRSYLQLVSRRTKEENILYKINQMSTRFDKRKHEGRSYI